MLMGGARISSPQRGFTLIELAVVVVVIALLLGSLLYPLNTQVEQRNVAETQRILEEAREALIGYAMIHGRLPRPAASETDGSERATCGGGNPNDACTGYIPWAVLGTPRIDAWGKLIRYSVTPALANSTFTLSATGNKYVKTRQDATEVNVASDAAAVLISHGAGNWGYLPVGAGITLGDNSATNVDEDANATNNGQNGGEEFWSRPRSENASAPGGEFDDVVVVLPMTIVVNRLISAGKQP
jgi:prepilin-type N-terminal cleavage/methylation domain-containing protein